MDYFVSDFTISNLPNFPNTLTDFSEFRPSFDLFEEQLRLNPEGYFTLRIQTELEPIIVQYSYAEPGLISVILTDDDELCMHDNYRLFVKDTGKILGVIIDKDSHEDPTDIVKIILDYGEHLTRGLQWAAFLWKEELEGTLDQYFDDLYKLEIH